MEKLAAFAEFTAFVLEFIRTSVYREFFREPCVAERSVSLWAGKLIFLGLEYKKEA